MVIVADFTEGQTVFPAIAEALQDLDIAVLVNNVGLSYLHPDYFLTVPKEVSYSSTWIRITELHATLYHYNLLVFF